MKKYILLASILLCNLQVMLASKSVTIKYSERDCINCTMGLISVANIYKDAPKKIVFKESFLSSEHAKELMSIVRDMDFAFDFSDSSYYALGSGERSMIYISSDNRLKYESFLAAFDPQKAEVALQSDAADDKNAKGITTRKQFAANSYLRDFPLSKRDNGFCYVSGSSIISHVLDKPTPDTTHLDNYGLENAVYKAHLGAKFEDSVQAIQRFYATNHVPSSTRYYCPLIVGDTTHILCFVPAYKPKQKNVPNSGYDLIQLGALVRIVKNKVYDVHTLELGYLRDKEEQPSTSRCCSL